MSVGWVLICVCVAAWLGWHYGYRAGLRRASERMDVLPLGIVRAQRHAAREGRQ